MTICWNWLRHTYSKDLFSIVLDSGNIIPTVLIRLLPGLVSLFCWCYYLCFLFFLISLLWSQQLSCYQRSYSVLSVLTIKDTFSGQSLSNMPCALLFSCGSLEERAWTSYRHGPGKGLLYQEWGSKVASQAILGQKAMKRWKVTSYQWLMIPAKPQLSEGGNWGSNNKN